MAKRLVCVLADNLIFRVGGLMPRGWNRGEGDTNTDVYVSGIRVSEPWVILEFKDGTETHLPQSRVALGYVTEKEQQSPK